MIDLDLLLNVGLNPLRINGCRLGLIRDCLIDMEAYSKQGFWYNGEHYIDDCALDLFCYDELMDILKYLEISRLNEALIAA